VPTPAPAAGPDIATLLERAVDNLTTGKVSFNPPDRMSTGQTVQMEARIDKKPPAAAPTPLHGPGPTREEPIRVANVMQALLISESPALIVTELSTQEQVVTDEMPGSWRWNVKAVRAGSQRMNLRVTAKVRTEGSQPTEKTRDVAVLDQTLEVAVDPMFYTSEFAQANWQWIVGALASIATLTWKRDKVRNLLPHPLSGPTPKPRARDRGKHHK
jgi:hypothetical protein